ncbi:unnamed protein product [Parascedosporium putredinis]|uniref:Uncharacterized protein n=1 Tax=Parascedosporium putredinis TaxID=1442378 RepID=A0A9P1M6N2_9PEZI|nr:unnamed protein product [Parascedosporium putredinis]CAI7988739.1 unnamed protein product [Parascedosporium putredinis]
MSSKFHFSIDRHTGVPKDEDHFSKGEPSENETRSQAHREFRSEKGHLPHAGLNPSRSSTGVIWVTDRAGEHGFLENPQEWANLGQGAPDVEDDIAGCFQRPTSVDVAVSSREYAPVAGIRPLREAVARLYNEEHRKGKESQYTWENVAIVPGGGRG